MEAALRIPRRISAGPRINGRCALHQQRQIGCKHGDNIGVLGNVMAALDESLEVVDCALLQAVAPRGKRLAGAAGAAQYRRSVWESAHNAVMRGKQVPCPIMRLFFSESLGLLGLCESSTRAVLCVCSVIHVGALQQCDCGLANLCAALRCVHNMQRKVALPRRHMRALHCRGVERGTTTLLYALDRRTLTIDDQR